MVRLKMFYWRGIDSLQRKQKGIVIAEDSLLAMYKLRQQGITQIKLQRYWLLSRKPKTAEFGEFVNQLSVLLAAHIPLKQSLQILLKGATNVELYQWINNLLKDIERGLVFSQALEHYPRYFSLQERQTIKIGEISGKLALVLQQIALHKTRILALQRKVQKVLLYPVIILLVSLSLSFLLLLFVVPQFAEMYGNIHNLPVFTQTLLSISSFLQEHWICLVIANLILFIFGSYLVKHSRYFQYKKEKLISHLPWINRLLQLSRVIQFSQGMQLMMQAGVPINQALSSFLPNEKQWEDAVLMTWLQQQIKDIQHLVNQGYSFSESVGSELFSTQLQQMLKVGEETGQLGKMLQHIAENEQQRLDHQIDLLSQLIEPLMMLIIGSLIGFIMVGMYLPIFQMGSMIQ